MQLLAERGRRISVDELNTTRLLAHARKQSRHDRIDPTQEMARRNALLEVE